MRRGCVLSIGAVLLAAGCGAAQVTSTGPGGGGTPGGPSPGGGPSPPVFTLPDAGPMSAPPAAPVGPPPSDQMNCGLNRIELQARPGQLLLVLDRSGSMAQQLGPQQPVEKWGETVKALDAVLASTEAVLPWGLKLYPLGAVCAVPADLTVPIAASNRAAILEAVNRNRPYIDGGATPTRDAILKAVENLKAQPTMLSPHLLIATDGIPNCNGVVGNPPDPDGAVQAVEAAAAAGIPSFVVGIATAGTDAHETLNRMAVAGGRARNDAVKYYPVGSRDELVAAFTSISSAVAACTFPLANRPPVPDNVAVEVGGQRIAPDPARANGWYYGPGGMSIVLAGPACDKVKDRSVEVKIIFGCPNQPIP